jgi:hypothetical protein
LSSVFLKVNAVEGNALRSAGLHGKLPLEGEDLWTPFLKENVP